MLRLSLARIALVVAVILGVVGWAAFQRYWYYLPGIMATIRDPVGPNREVTWEKGPAARPEGTTVPDDDLVPAVGRQLNVVGRSVAPIGHLHHPCFGVGRGHPRLVHFGGRFGGLRRWQLGQRGL